MIRLYWIVLFALVLGFRPLTAGEGMWLPFLLEQLNEAEMQAMGMKMTAEDIYSVNKGSLKDAIVHFGGFCTAEIISPNGLLLTNHHCGYGQIQQHSSLENNYLEDGFWAPNQAAELPNPGLTATFIVRMEDVTQQVLAGVTDELSEKERQAAIDGNIQQVRYLAVKEPYQSSMIRPFYQGNQYILFVTETYRDVRLVGAPPSSIGKFGADTDNWVWPRHTGDFSLFRIYAGPDNRPADYSPNNKPLQPRHFLPISLDGVAPGDFTLVFGFPGRTDEYLPAVAVDQRINVLNPIRIGIRDKSLALIGAAMRADPATKIQYASKQSSIANSWKKWIGESQGARQTGAVAKKLQLEADFQQRVQAKPAWKKAYGSLLADLKDRYTRIEPYARVRDYVNEIASVNVELFRRVNILNRYVKIYENNGMTGLQPRLPDLLADMEEFYKDYNSELDARVAAELLDIYYKEVPSEYQADLAREQLKTAESNTAALVSNLFGKSMLTKSSTALPLLKENPEAFFRQLTDDPAYRFVRAIVETNEAKVLETYNALNSEIEPLQRRYMEALMTVFPERRFYPDANGTLRVTYGKVEGYEPRDAVEYEPVTYLEGVMEKYVPGDYEFDVPARLIELYNAKDYGPYADAEGMPVCFIGSNHTTGGNSGSPAIDAHGNLVGLNFDRTWEGTMSDINYDVRICRNIMVDIRYVLFLIDKFAGANHLVEEMTLVHPKSKPNTNKGSK